MCLNNNNLPYIYGNYASKGKKRRRRKISSVIKMLKREGAKQLVMSCHNVAWEGEEAK